MPIPFLLPLVAGLTSSAGASTAGAVAGKALFGGLLKKAAPTLLKSAGLFFGKKAIDSNSGELSEAKAGQKQAMSNIQSMQMSPESQSAYQASQGIMRQGMGEASRQMAIQENARMFNAGMRTSGIRSKLGMLSAFNSNDFATRLAAENERQRQQNIMTGIQTGLQFGAQKTALDQYKTEQLMNYNLGREANINKSKTNLLTGIGSVAGSLIGAAGQAGSFSNLFKKS